MPYALNSISLTVHLRRLTCLIFLVSVGYIAASPVVSLAQNVQFTKNSQDIGLRSDLKVDPSTLGMNIQLPLRVYAGRGGADLPITLYYSSKVWRLRYNGYYTGYVGTIGVDNLGNFSMARAMYGEDSAAGWTSSLDVPRIVHTDSIEEEVYNGNGRPCADTGVTGPSSPCYPANQRTVGRLRIRLPDGSIHELRKSDTVIFKTQSTGTGTYYAVDGSRLRYETQTATLYLPDGARYILGAELGQNTSQYIDRNGNTLTFTSAIGSAQPAGIWTDTAGRSVSLPPLDYSNNATRAVGDQSYTLRSVAGTNITYIFRWRRLNEVRTDGNQTLYYTGDKLCGGSYRQAFSPSLFASSGDGSSGSDTLVCGEEFNPVVLAEIVLPTGSSYKFTYNLFGEIDKVVYPTGGYERYGYAAVASLNPSGAPYDQANRGVSDRWVSTDGTITDENAHHWQYSTSGDVVNTMAPDGTHTRRLLRVGRQFSTVYFGFDDARAGMPYDEITYSATSQMVSRKLSEWAVTEAVATTLPTGENVIAQRNPRPTKEVEIVFDTVGGGNALAKTTIMGYDGDLNVTSTTESAYAEVVPYTAQNSAIGSIPQGPTLRISETDYALSANQAYRDRQLIALPTASRVKDSAGNVIAQSSMRYDEAAYPLIGLGSITGWSDPGTTARGNITTVSRWLNTTNTYLQTHAQYDSAGNARNSWDANGNVSSVDYAAAYQYAYPTSTTSAIPDPSGVRGSSMAFTTSTAYDFNTGLVTSSTNANSQTTTLDYTDALNRLKKVTSPDGGETTYNYGDTTGNLYVETLTKQDATTTLDSYKYFDGLGRAWRTALKEDTSAYTISDTQYDSLGRVWKISNPYRATTLTGAANLATATTTLYDALGRVLSVTTPDGAVVTTSYSGTQVTVKDQANKQRRSLTDALGRLAKVEELSESATISSTTPIYSTTLYGYDVLGNLRSVRQGGAVQGDGTMTGGQTRSFEYDSLSRLTSAMNPESGTISYQYDGNGNVLTKRDARGITTTYGYDALNRVQTRSYIGDTPAVTYTYDAAGVTNSKGRLTSLSSSVSTTSYGEYDALGRVKQSTQTTSGAPSSYVMSYGYDLAGHKTSETYPSGRVITTVYGGAGREQSVAGQISGANKTYASQFSYSAHGAVSAMQLGNGLWEHTAFNNRLQPEQIGLGTLSTNASILQLDYTYHAPNAADNNGNVQTQTITIPGLAVTQSYSYDSLNRLQVAQEQSGTSWKQAFRYDQFGNRNFDAGTTTTDLASKVTNPTISTATNQIDGTAAGQVNILYDPAGNLTRDVSGLTYGYDGENKQITYAGGSTITGGTSYYYDGDGHRVKKADSNTSTIYVYDVAGQLVAEYNTLAAQSSGGTSYLISDNLGSPRVITDASRNVKSRHDYLPFGEEISAGTGGRTQGQGYVGSADGVRQRYTSKERDDETGLDYFGARYYGSPQGRFTSPDPLLASGNIYDPQSWNRYAYTVNNPLKYTDPFGMYICNGNKGQCKDVENGLKNLEKARDSFKKGSNEYNRLDRSRTAYGAKGVDNGVAINFGATRNGGPADTNVSIKLDPANPANKLVTADNPTGQDITVTIDPNQTKSSDDYVLNLGHEGSHVADGSDLVGALPTDLTNPAAVAVLGGSLNLTKYVTETRAYEADSFIAQARGAGSLTIGKAKYEIWNSGWSQADRATKRAAGIDKVLAEPKSKGGLYEVTPTNQGPKLIQ